MPKKRVVNLAEYKLVCENMEELEEEESKELLLTGEMEEYEEDPDVRKVQMRRGRCW